MPLNGLSSGASTDLGLGDMLGMQTRDETEEQRRKRLQDMQQQKLGFSPAASMLYPNGFGGGLGR